MHERTVEATQSQIHPPFHKNPVDTVTEVQLSGRIKNKQKRSPAPRLIAMGHHRYIYIYIAITNYIYNYVGHSPLSLPCHSSNLK